MARSRRTPAGRGGPSSLSERLGTFQRQAARRRVVRTVVIVTAAVAAVLGGNVLLASLRPPLPAPTPVWAGPVPPAASIAATHDTRLAGWHLVWDDEFDSPPLTYRLWSVKSFLYPYNYQLQYYSRSHVAVAAGALHLTVTNTPEDGRPYTSAWVSTQGTMAWQYGMIVIRAKLPADAGLFPALWMLPADAGKVVLPEVDIMEAKGGHVHRVFMTLHWAGPGRSLQSTGTSYAGPNFTTGFHTFALKWTPHQLTWYVDGVVRFQTTQHVPHVPMYVIMDVAVGGAFPGNPPPTDRWPAAMVVKYVRLYKPGPPAPPIPASVRPPAGAR